MSKEDVNIAELRLDGEAVKPKYAEGLWEFENQREIGQDGAPTYVETIRDWLYTSFLIPYYKYCEAGNEITIHCNFNIYDYKQGSDDLKPGITTTIQRFENSNERMMKWMFRELILGVPHGRPWFFVQQFDLDSQYINSDLKSGDYSRGDLCEAVYSMLNDVIVRVRSEDPWWSEIKHEVFWDVKGPYPWHSADAVSYTHLTLPTKA